jgi:hypothetical protein
VFYLFIFIYKQHPRMSFYIPQPSNQELNICDFISSNFIYIANLCSYFLALAARLRIKYL